MLKRPLVTLAAGAALLVAACSSSGASTAPSTAASAAPSVAASAPAVTACAESVAAGEVAVAIKGFAFNPADIQAKVGQTVTFTNGDSAPHTATLDDGTCTTPNIASGKADGLVFTAAGTYPFHCRVHPTMKGTITVS